MDVEGYPVNISYHGGVNMEQEASWVGLGWNINVGEVNHSVRGMPDDYQGDSIMKQVHINPERNMRIGAGVGVEPAGIGQPIVNLSANLTTNVNISNYRGVSVDFGFGGGVNVFHTVSAGVNMGVGSQSGAGIDYNAGLQAKTSQQMSDEASGGVGVSMSQGYNSRSGIKDRTFSWSTNGTADGNSLHALNGSAVVPIGTKNIVPVITNASTMNSIFGQVKVGGELFWCYGHATVNANASVLRYDENGSRRGYGYLYPDKAGSADIQDFTRDKDGNFNKNMQYLPAGNMTYDIYSVTGQGTGGSFRPFRNDFGSVYDPLTESSTNNQSHELEAGIGWNFSIGYDATITKTDVTSGPWYEFKRKFVGNKNGSIYEGSYFKQAGEMTAVDPGYYNQVGGTTPLTAPQMKALDTIKYKALQQRDPRASLINYITAKDAAVPGVADQQKLYSYTSLNGFANGPVTTKDSFDRYESGNLKRKQHHISEVVQTQTDGRRYVYGIPAMNNVQKEVTFSITKPTDTNDLAKGLVPYVKGHDDSDSNNYGKDHYYSATTTPAFAHSYLLTSVLSTDYIDITGDGPTDDDFGTYTKFNYSRKESDYRWRAPIENSKAQYNPGFWSDKNDDKANYLAGSREQWYLHSIETKNYVAEFYVSPRHDAKGVTDAILNAGTGYNQAPYNQDLTKPGSSYKLDSIKLYNKHDRFINQSAAVPIKTVIFTYDYSLCAGVPNVDSAVGTLGKLTLKRINVRYGNSDKSMISPYVFDYSSFNPGYNLACKDRWGSYKRNKSSFTNYEYPFTDQSSDSLDIYASAWSLTNIGLPSGGAIQVNYEADDYGYVQDKRAAEMFMVTGLGNTPNMTLGSQLYYDKKTPNLYVYFKRRLSAEKANLSFYDNYLKGMSCLYYNFNTKLVDNFFEPVKGYAAFDTTTTGSGVCPNNPDYGYVKLKVQHPDEGNSSVNLNPVSYTALNFGRYHLPHIIFPGSDPDQSDLHNVLAGLKYSFNELVSLAKNPIIRMTEEGRAQYVNLFKSFIRLNSPGLKKKGGGQRVKSLLFYDSWAAMAGGNAQNATYGKQYDYTKEDEASANGVISSGVASYEPQIGGDENPLRMPVPYTAQDGSHFPANDPVTLYQEAPIGESLYPGASVGYSKVTVSSIHKDEGRSSQGIDIHEFYTARDFPVQFDYTGRTELQKDEKYGFVHQRMIYKYAQGYTLTFNDMHGKPKKNEHRVIKPKDGSTELISYQIFKYYTQGGKLSNTVPVLQYSAPDHKMKISNQQLGQEMDLTIDSRHKDEYTSNDAFYANLNTSTVGWFTIPVPLPIPWSGDYHNEYDFAIATKVIQQYGVISQVESYQEGAITKVSNEAFDPVTGQALITSVNNEYQDREYSVNYPAYWGYRSMGPAYQNTGYADSVDNIPVTSYAAMLPAGDAYVTGDELLVYYQDASGNHYTANAFVKDRNSFENARNKNCNPVIAPRFTYITPGWPANGTLYHAQVKIIRSGYKNQLNESMESYTTMTTPFTGGLLNENLTDLIDIKAKEFSNSNVGVLPRILTATNAIAGDSLNEFVSGRKEIYRVWKEYAYQKNRNYVGNTVRKMGLFDAASLWKTGTMNTNCLAYPNDLPYLYMKPSTGTDNNWITARTVTMWSPYGTEVENKDAVGNYSTAIYGYNNSLPVAIGQNATYGELMAEGFEDYRLLQVMSSWSAFSYVPFAPPVTLTALAAGTSLGVNIPGTNTGSLVLTKNIAHTGYYSIKVPSGGTNISLPLRATQPSNSNQPVLQPFALLTGQKYILSYWIRANDITTNTTDYSGLPTSAIIGNSQTWPLVKKSNIIDGWQQVEARFTASNPSNLTALTLALPAGYYVDDIRIFPVDANMKAFAYDPVTQKLMATMDENNFATLYEYDQEGNLVRTKKETERGIITVSESRSANPKK
jgi:hypothetical protein